MKEYGASTFGELNADGYDVEHDPGTTSESIDLLWDIAANGKTLELAIGTGRLALPLKLRGLDICGIDASSEMLAKLQEKPGGETIPVVVGNMADVDIEGSFDFVFLAFNTLFNLRSQNEQIRCLVNAAAKLNPGGKFLLEMVVPDIARYSGEQNMQALHVDMQSALVEAAVHDPVAQTVEFQRIRITQDGVRLRPFPMRYVWPSELDLMAQLAGMTRVARWGGWHRQPFTRDSTMHVSLYEKV